uniref:glial cell line-derived neurotrophic factor n=1 Tax=Oncorhynchus gorbuscha TaxID=8017 RepID=UPI001EAF6BFB|nr:glial cell line-derived neurotrophic factor [Oncorhynchus gorbuscha]
MKLWDTFTTCFVLLSSVHTSPLRNRQSTKRTRASESLHDFPPMQLSIFSTKSPETADREERSVETQYNMVELQPEQFEDVVDFIKVTISRLKSSLHLGTGSRIRMKRERRKGGKGATRGKDQRERSGIGRGRGRGKGGRGQGCLLKQIHLNVTDLGLGYQTSEEMIFRYCSGPCRNSETNYDKILNNLTQNKRLLPETPPHACCRPVAFDDDLSFLDDHLMYHTMRKHSARRCGCV